MKRFFALLSVFVLVISMCACTKTESPEVKPSQPETVEEQPIQVEKLVSIEEVEKPELVPIENVKPKWEEGSNEIIAPNGNRFEMPNYGWMIVQEGGRCLMLLNNCREIWLCDQEIGFTKLSGDQLVVNYTVADDAVYWFNLDREVWAVDRYSGTEAYLFCEDAIAVSPHTDEAQGAVVTWDRANIDYGYGLPIYSPYGE